MRYVAYGSNLHPVRLRDRTPSAYVLGTSTLPHRALRFCKRSQDGSGKATLVEDSKSSVHVAIYELSDDEVQALDKIEGLGNGYDKHWISVGEFGDCFTYLAPSAWRDEALLPYAWYRELVLVGCAFHQFPETYIASVEGHAAVYDPDAHRHSLNMRIVERAHQHLVGPHAQRKRCRDRRLDRGTMRDGR